MSNPDIKFTELAVSCPNGLAKVDCGFFQMTQSQCLAKGCCWVPLAPGAAGPWCIVGLASSATPSVPASGPVCDLVANPLSRTDCGFFNINQDQCIAKGCCWGPLAVGAAGPWCFKSSSSPVLPPAKTSPPVASSVPTSAQACDLVANPLSRTDCGFFNINQDQCIAKGCCWGPLAVGAAGPWCFKSSSSPVLPPAKTSPPVASSVPTSAQVCDLVVKPSARGDCGFFNINQDQCIAKGCCWGPLAVGAAGPWCFFKTASAPVLPSATPTIFPPPVAVSPITSPAKPALVCDLVTETSKRQDCGFTNINMDQCLANGCCWGPVPAGQTGPWCFAKTYTSLPSSALFPRPTLSPNGINFQLASRQLACTKSATIDVNYGNSWSDFTTSAYCQVYGTLPPASLMNSLQYQPENPRTRRIDVIRTMCANAGRSCALKYSDPWANGQMALPSACVRKNTRDLGAIFMFFFYCPAQTNCDLDWANNHAYGFKTQEPVYNGYLNPSNYGFWLREFTDAAYAGLQFLLPNVYGPDIYTTPSVFPMMNQALGTLNGAMKLGLMDDTWIWGTGYGGAMFANPPNLFNVQNAAQVLYSTKWKPFFQGVQKQYWYTVQGRPFIYFYNAGTLKPASQVTIVVEAMKRLFLADFGVAPFVVLDIAFPPGNAADAQFLWDTFYLSSNLYFSPPNQSKVSVANFMPRWDSKGRDAPGQILQSTDRLAKGPELLVNNLFKTESTNIVVMGTWNDLGEGTGINRCYDYYYKGQWLPPNYFMDITRAAQCV